MSTRVAEASETLRSELGERVTTDEPLGKRTTFRVGGTAAIFVEAESLSDVTLVAEVSRQTGVPIVTIGRGSNMLVADDGFDGIALSITNLGASPAIDQDTAIVMAGGGVELPRLARQTAAAGLTGFEWAVGVPGSIGGAVRMNAGGHGSDMAECLIDVAIIDIDREAGVRTLTADQLGLRFRASNLPPSAVVLSARLQLAPGDSATAKDTINEIVKWRREHQPGGQNCGSVFVNPIPGRLTAGELIDEAGLKGFRIGTSQVSDKHANFIQAGDGGTAADVQAVIETVRATVAERSGVWLRSEVRMVGFGEAESPALGAARSS